MPDPTIIPFLAPSEFIDSDHPAVIAQARALAQPDITATAKAAFEWVRDNVLHSRDHEKNPVTCRASDVLKHRTGYCYAKSHLLAALLRANNIPAGLCYQRLSVNDTGAPYCLHGFNALHLPNSAGTASTRAATAPASMPALPRPSTTSPSPSKPPRNANLKPSSPSPSPASPNS